MTDVNASGQRAAVEASVVVATRDRPGQLRGCLEALTQQITDRAYEVVVIDDGGEPPVAASDLAAFPRVRLLREAGRGPAAARNLGVREARGAFILFTDDDALPEPGWLEAACRFLDASPSCVGVGGVTVSPPFDYLYEESVACDVPAYWTCNVAYRRETLEELGAFCEAFRQSCNEDLDLGYRALELGDVGFAPEMRVVHVPRKVSVRQLIARGRLVSNDVLLVSRHPDRYRCPPWYPRRLLPVAGLAVRWSRLLHEEGVSLLRSPRRLARFFVIALGQVSLGAATAVATSTDNGRRRR
jgi:glycosyltransferase involved in cell wall biosynthesis